MKKQLFAAFIACLCTVVAFAQDAETFSLTVGSSKRLDLPFAIENYRLTPQGKVTIEELNKQQLNVTGTALGDCSLIVMGGGLTREYRISVKSNINNILKRLRTDLDAVPELDISINQDYIVIRGTVSNPENWRLFQKVLPMYPGVHNFAVFRPSAETMLNLKKMLQEAGFTFAEEGKAPELGQISMNITPDAVVITGELCSDEQITKINQILSTQTWLAVGDMGASEAAGRVRGIVNLNVVKTQLVVDIVYVGVTDSDAEHFGSQAPTANLNANWMYDLIHGRKTEGSTVTFGSNMQQTLGFLADNGITRRYEAGHVTFLNHDEKGGTLHTGGTVSVKVSGMNSGALQDIDFGLKITVKGGLVDPNKVKLDMSIENTSLVTTSGDSYTRDVDSTQQSIYCGLDKTVVLAGSRKIAQNARKSGLPILRNTPVLNWFVSEKGDSKSETRLLILACPRLVTPDSTVEITIPLSKETASTYNEAKGDLKEDLKKKEAAKPWYKRWFGK
ncbi:MAG: type II and III secretion system protein [Lentisphaeria bacterium]|nr:type II and III secretion system protein [Lentisphaeria bacterium]